MRYPTPTLIALLMLTACVGGSHDAPTPTRATPSPRATPTPRAPAPAKTRTTMNTKRALPPVPEVAPELMAAVSGGLNTFGLNLYRELASTPGDQVISPASVALALAMVHAGARGNTAKELADALHMSRPVAEVQSTITAMMMGWARERERAELTVANRLFGDRGVAFEGPFLDLTGRSFGAPLDRVDFRTAAEAARQEINSWVADRTHERIENLLPPGSVDATTRLVLVNAIYFKSAWMRPFPEYRTAPAPFHAAHGTHDVPTMRITRSLMLVEDTKAGVQAVELAYQDARFSMMVVMPTGTGSLSGIERDLTPERIATWRAAQTSQRIDLSLPKFRIAPPDALRLGQVLNRLGIGAAFTSDADLTGMAPAHEQLQLAEGYHKGFIEVDEKGTEAAAATAIAAPAGGLPPTGEPRAIRFDRPFVFLIRDDKTGMILFVGRVTDPSTA